MATYLYNKTNVLKLRVMNVLYVGGCLRGSKKALTCKEIEYISGVPSEYVSRLMSRCRKIKANYFIRLKPISGRDYRYQLSKLGVKWYFMYLTRFYQGFELNCARSQPKRMSHFNPDTKVDLKQVAVKGLPAEILKKYIGVTKAYYEKKADDVKIQ